MHRNKWLWVLTLLLMWILLLWGNSLYESHLHRQLVSPEGGSDPFFNPLIFPINYLVILSFLSLPVSMIGMCFRQTRKFFHLPLLWGLTTVTAVVAINGHSKLSPRMEAFMQLGQRLEPLVQAIEQYHKDNNRYPSKLEELVPNYLPNLPSTGMAAYPTYRYIASEKASEWNGNPWVIVMKVGWGMGFDRFMYFPLQNYPAEGYGGVIRRLGKWAYVFE